MAATRTQIYLTTEQRRRLDELATRKDKSLATVVREAVDLYLEQQRSDPGAVLEATFGALPPLQIPSRDEWDDG